jgi:hypothetical protein
MKGSMEGRIGLVVRHGHGLAGGTVNLPLSTCRTAVARRRGAILWRYAAMVSSANLRHATIASERSARSPDDDMAWRGTLWRLATRSWIKTERWRCRADVNRVMIRCCRRVCGGTVINTDLWTSAVCNQPTATRVPARGLDAKPHYSNAAEGNMNEAMLATGISTRTHR